MNRIILIILSTLTFTLVNAQSDTTNTELVQIPNSEYAVYQYDSLLNDSILTYQYFNICDIDNDGLFDSIMFVGNGGAHIYFNLKLKISTNGKWIDYPTLYIDMPYLKDTIEEITQFAVSDFDDDGIDEVFLNIDNPFGSIPDNLKTGDLTSKRLIIEFEKGRLIIRNYKEK